MRPYYAVAVAALLLSPVLAEPASGDAYPGPSYTGGAYTGGAHEDMIFRDVAAQGGLPADRASFFRYCISLGYAHYTTESLIVQSYSIEGHKEGVDVVSILPLPEQFQEYTNAKRALDACRNIAVRERFYLPPDNANPMHLGVGSGSIPGDL